MLDSQDLPPPRILLADDDENFLPLATIMLKQQGFVVTPAADGVRAIDILDEVGDSRPFDMLVLDILMPGATGWEVLARAREGVQPGQPLPKVLLITGFNAEFIVDVDMLRREGAAGILLKPFDNEDFISEVGRILEADPLIVPEPQGDAVAS